LCVLASVGYSLRELIIKEQNNGQETKHDECYYSSISIAYFVGQLISKILFCRYATKKNDANLRRDFSFT